jgi:ABC-type sugar transport system ATPase subunit
VDEFSACSIPPSQRARTARTTLVKLLAKLYEPTSGAIQVNGLPLARMRADAWRERLAGAFQDFFRFELPARQSIGVGDVPRLDEEPAVLRAVERAGADDVVARWPASLDTQLGPTWPGVVDVSFGQWQKLALARGFMRDHPLLLVLDEPTAALDAETEHALFERFAAAAHRDAAETADYGRITVLVSHRFSTVAWPISSSFSTARASSRSARTRSSWRGAGSTPSCMGFRRRTGEVERQGSTAAPMRNQSANKTMVVDILLHPLGPLKLLLSNLPSIPGNLLKLGRPLSFDFGKGQIPLLPVLDA